jgi:hypothetical protein
VVVAKICQPVKEPRLQSDCVESRKTRYPGGADVVAGEGGTQSDHDRTRRKSDDALGNAVFMIVYFNMASIEESPAQRRHGPAGAKHEEADISRICVVKAGLLVPPIPAGESLHPASTWSAPGRIPRRCFGLSAISFNQHIPEISEPGRFGTSLKSCKLRKALELYIHSHIWEYINVQGTPLL